MQQTWKTRPKRPSSEPLNRSELYYRTPDDGTDKGGKIRYAGTGGEAFTGNTRARRPDGVMLSEQKGPNRAQRRRPRTHGGTRRNWGVNQPYTNPARLQIKAERETRRAARKAARR